MWNGRNLGHRGQEESTRNCPGMYETQGKTGTILQPSVPKRHIRRLKGLQVVKTGKEENSFYYNKKKCDTF